MSYEEVVKIGESVGLNELQFFSSFSLLQYIIYISIPILLSYLFIKIYIEEFIFILLFLMIFVVPGFTWLYKDSIVEQKNISEVIEYKNEVGNPYVYSLQEEKKELIYLKVDREAVVSGAFSLGNGSINSKIMSIFSVIYKDGNNAVSMNIEVIPVMNLSEDETPYISYKKLDKYLPHYEEGFYDVKLYLPNNYKFTDIK